MSHSGQTTRKTAASADSQQTRLRNRKELRHAAGTVLLIVLAVLVIQRWGFNISMVRGTSMQPTLQPEQWLFVNKTVPWMGEFGQGDMVILKEPASVNRGEHPYLVKRIVATAGQRVEIADGRLYIDGKEAVEPYSDARIEDGDFGPLVVAEGTLFVMGDNRRREGSLDSRFFGSVPEGGLIGRAEWIVWPPSSMSGL
ncbi:signal peptidase I [Paenibacillus sp. FJAT-26967]|uniref:signal peptidase I n=1 Tax=Paenibacillus sp. FJAT-26967 TaxID=1729690 RepID=UPI00083882A3|nr:signal peptidase I [Paenibacillus sp. FJAT-26967]